MSIIRFFNEDCKFDLPRQNQINNWLRSIITEENKEIGELNYIFCSDEHLLKLNGKFLDHHHYTDILTFDQSDDTGILSADIFISIDSVKENAASFQQKFEDELHRVMVHGILHLLGYEDKSDFEIAQMRKKEQASLSLLDI